MRVFLTGATGLLGNNLARLLAARGDRVTVLVRTEPHPEVFEGLDVDIVDGELLDAECIDEAVSRCDAVIHSAAVLHIGWRRMEESLRVNRDGTSVVAEAALRHRRPMVHISTVNTLALGRGKPTTEDTPLTPAASQVPCAYVTSKLASNEVVREAVRRGLDARIVHPGFMLGPWDWKPSSGKMMLELARRYVPCYPTGGCSVCDVRDVASGVLAAMDQGRPGRSYILAGANVTYRRLWQEMTIRLGRSMPSLPAGPLIRFAVGTVMNLGTRLTGNEGDINSASMKMGSQLHWHDSSRAREELGYSNRTFDETLDDAAAWIRNRFLKSPAEQRK